MRILDAVDQQKRAAAGQPPSDVIGTSDIEYGGDGGHDVGLGGDLADRDRRRAAGEIVDHLVRDRDRDAGLPDTGHTDERDQPRARHGRGDLGDLGITADQRRARWQVEGHSGAVAGRGEHRPALGTDHAERHDQQVDRCLMRLGATAFEVTKGTDADAGTFCDVFLREGTHLAGRTKQLSEVCRRGWGSHAQTLSTSLDPWQ